MADLEVGLADNRLVPTVAAAFPPMLAGAFAVVGDDCEVAEGPADPVLAGRPAQAPAALPVTGLELARRGGNVLSAVTDAVPQNLPGAAALRQHFPDDQLAEALAGQVLRTGVHLHTLLLILAVRIPTGRRPAVLQIAGSYLDRPAAVAQAPPYGISVLAPGRGLHSHNIAEPLSGQVFCSAHACYSKYVPINKS